MDGKEARRVARALGVAAGDDLSIEVTSRTATGRAARVRVASGGVSRETQAALFRKAAGYMRVRSLAFEMRRVGDSWMILGEGYGHGVGLCQWGANGMAKAGKEYREILARYYPGTAIPGGGS
jgi:stage II sporulation protein D